MVFNINGKPKIPIGTKRVIYKFCLLPLSFRGKTYWLQKIMLEEVFTKESITVCVEGGGYTKDGWCIKHIYIE